VDRREQAFSPIQGMAAELDVDRHLAQVEADIIGLQPDLLLANARRRIRISRHGVNALSHGRKKTPGFRGLGTGLRPQGAGGFRGAHYSRSMLNG
jgi:hypothetical protein